MTDQSGSDSEALVVVERNGVHRIEVREVLQQGESYFLLFARSDGSEIRVPIDAAKLKKTQGDRVPADLIYQGGSIVTPQQET